MGQYSEEWWFSTGALAANQRAAVFEEDQNTLASIFSDAGLTVPLANPTTTDANGVLTFYAADGSYWIFVGKTNTGDSVLATIGANPDNPVLSVNGELPDGGGNVTLTAADVGAQPIATIDALGDLYVGTGPDTTTRLPRGADGEVLSSNSGEPTGLEWIPAGGGGAVDSVNGQTGVVVLDAADVGADPAGAAVTASTRTLDFADDRAVLTTGAGVARWYNREGVDLVIERAWVSAGVQPTGAAILVDVNLDGTTIYTTQGNRPTVAAASNGGAATVPDVTAFPQGSYLTVDIDQIGSTIAGGRLAVGVVVRRSA